MDGSLRVVKDLGQRAVRRREPDIALQPVLAHVRLDRTEKVLERPLFGVSKTHGVRMKPNSILVDVFITLTQILKSVGKKNNQTLTKKI